MSFDQQLYVLSTEDGTVQLDHNENSTNADTLSQKGDVVIDMNGMDGKPVDIGHVAIEMGPDGTPMQGDVLKRCTD